VHVEIDPVVGGHAGESLRDGAQRQEGSRAHGAPIVADGPTRRPPGFCRDGACPGTGREEPLRLFRSVAEGGRLVEMGAAGIAPGAAR
jgi:hypothetical protein